MPSSLKNISLNHFTPSDYSDLPLISVIIPAYNASSHIAETISSVMKQTYQNIEIIVVNDGSTDDTAHELTRLRQSEPRIKIIEQKNGGPSAARNIGILSANGDYIAFMDSDDEWDFRKLELQMRGLENEGNKRALSLTAFTFCLPSGNRYPVPYPDKKLTFKDVIQSGFGIMPSSWLIPRHLFDASSVGLFDENMRCAEDADWILRAMKAEVKPIIENKALTFYKVSDFSKRYKGQAEGIGELVDRHGDWMRKTYPSHATDDLLETFNLIRTQDVSIAEVMGAFSSRHAPSRQASLILPDFSIQSLS